MLYDPIQSEQHYGWSNDDIASLQDQLEQQKADESDFYDGEWEAIIQGKLAPDFTNKSPKWWEGYLTRLAARHGIGVSVEVHEVATPEVEMEELEEEERYSYAGGVAEFRAYWFPKSDNPAAQHPEGEELPF